VNHWCKYREREAWPLDPGCIQEIHFCGECSELEVEL